MILVDPRGRRSHRAELIGLIAFVVASTGIGASPAAAAPTSFRTSGYCDHLSTAVMVDSARARAVVPSRCTLLEPVPGSAILALVTQNCRSAIDNRPATAATNSVVFVFVDPVRSPAGCEIYDLFWTNSRNDDWQRAMRGIGVVSDLVPATRMRLAGSGASVAGAVNNPYRRAPFAYTAQAADAVHPSVPLTSVHCQLGRRGLVRQTYNHQIQAGGGTAVIQLGPSRLWSQLGVQGGTSVALLARFTWTGVTEIVRGT